MKITKFGKYLSIIGFGVIIYFIYCFNINNTINITIDDSFMFYLVCILFIIICVMYLFTIKYFSKKIENVLKENSNFKDKINEVFVVVKSIKEEQIEIENDVCSKLNFIERIIVDLSGKTSHDK